MFSNIKNAEGCIFVHFKIQACDVSPCLTCILLLIQIQGGFQLKSVMNLIRFVYVIDWWHGRTTSKRAKNNNTGRRSKHDGDVVVYFCKYSIRKNKVMHFPHFNKILFLNHVLPDRKFRNWRIWLKKTVGIQFMVEEIFSWVSGYEKDFGKRKHYVYVPWRELKKFWSALPKLHQYAEQYNYCSQRSKRTFSNCKREFACALPIICELLTILLRVKHFRCIDCFPRVVLGLVPRITKLSLLILVAHALW